MPLPATEQEWLTYLAMLHDRELVTLRQYDKYYEGQQPLTYMQADIQRLVADRIWPVILYWPQLVVDSIEERLDVEGFRLSDKDADDKDLWRVWQDNDLDEESQTGRVDALVMRRSFLAVGSNETDADTPLVTVESPLEVYAYVDTRTRQPKAALKRTVDPVSTARETVSYATLYLPDKTIWYESPGISPIAWKETGRDEHELGAVPIVPLINRARTADRYGRSELAPVIPLADAANKIATDMMVAAEFHAIPLRALFGVGPGDFEDQDGNKMTALQVIMGRLLAVPVEGSAVKPFEFAASSLANFHETIKLLAELVASMAGLPPHILGQPTDNPASAEAIRSSEARLVKRAERKQVAFGGAYERVMRLIRRIQSGEWDPRLRRLETVWRDASTPTRAAAADAATKLYTAGILPRRQVREDLGYTPAQIDNMESEDVKAAQMDPLAAIARGTAATGAPAAT
jgi:hypothetical protein